MSQIVYFYPWNLATLLSDSFLMKDSLGVNGSSNYLQLKNEDVSCVYNKTY